jgi:hypothetical protein
VNAGVARNICENATSLQLNGTPVVGGAGVWSGANISVTGLFDPIAAGIGTHIVVYTFTNNTTGCSKSAITTVNVTPNPAPTAGTDVSVCFGSPMFALGGSPTGGVWSGTGVTGNSFNPTALAAGNYTVTYTIYPNTVCARSNTKTITITPLPTVTVSSNSPVCIGGMLQFTASGNNNYTWEGPNLYTSNLQNPLLTGVTTAMAGLYTVTVTDINNCSTSQTANVVVNNLPNPSAGAPQSICETAASLQLNGTPVIGGTGVWSGANITAAGLFNPVAAGVHKRVALILRQQPFPSRQTLRPMPILICKFASVRRRLPWAEVLRAAVGQVRVFLAVFSIQQA